MDAWLFLVRVLRNRDVATTQRMNQLVHLRQSSLWHAVATKHVILLTTPKSPFFVIAFTQHFLCFFWYDIYEPAMTYYLRIPCYESHSPAPTGF